MQCGLCVMLSGIEIERGTLFVSSYVYKLLHRLVHNIIGSGSTIMSVRVIQSPAKHIHFLQQHARKRMKVLWSKCTSLGASHRTAHYSARSTKSS